MKYDSKIVVAWFAAHHLTAIPEYRFDSKRKWRFDFIMRDWNEKPSPNILTRENTYAVALEVEGGVWTQGRHTRGSGFVKDMEKYNRAAVLGWRVLRVTPDQLCMQETVDMVKEALRM